MCSCTYNLSSLDGKIFTNDVWQNRIGYFFLSLKYLLYSKQPIPVHFSWATLWFPKYTSNYPSGCYCTVACFHFGWQASVPCCSPNKTSPIPELLGKEFLQINHKFWCFFFFFSLRDVCLIGSKLHVLIVIRNEKETIRGELIPPSG